MLLRYLNVLAIGALVGSALYAYSVKYETILFSEQIVKVKHSIEREQDRIATLRAEWAYVTRPERLQMLADRHLDMLQLSPSQILLSASELPDQPPKVDTIGRKLESLGLAEPTNTPQDAKAAGSAVTPSTRPR